MQEASQHQPCKKPASPTARRQAAKQAASLRDNTPGKQAGIAKQQVSFKDADDAWAQAVRRLIVRVHARLHAHWRARMDALGKGQRAPSPAALNLLLSPLAEVGEDGGLTWADAFADAMEAVGVTRPEPRVSEAQREQAPTPRRVVAFSKPLVSPVCSRCARSSSHDCCTH